MKVKFVIEYDNTSLRMSNRIETVLPKEYLKYILKLLCHILLSFGGLLLFERKQGVVNLGRREVMGMLRGVKRGET